MTELNCNIFKWNMIYKNIELPYCTSEININKLDLNFFKKDKKQK